ncbi:MAG: hypothetical protein IPG81_17270 [Sandaracinaceae bacterium]|nr:hypothetical protein [Sandaracinaceae bacterium]
MEARLINANTMVDHNSMDLRFAVMLKKGKDARQTEHFQRGYVENMSKGFQGDIDLGWRSACREPRALRGRRPLPQAAQVVPAVLRLTPRPTRRRT